MSTINFFHFDNVYHFKHYFENYDLFKKLQKYYVESEYRFEISEDEVKKVMRKLRDYGYKVNFVVEDEISEYTVTIDKYEKHTDLLKKSVDVTVLGDEKTLVLKDKVAKEVALDRKKESNKK